MFAAVFNTGAAAWSGHWRKAGIISKGGVPPLEVAVAAHGVQFFRFSRA
ncbi:hypothetical protein [Pseudarthrobacter sp. NamB4]|nr:hypothetical protein [Pseudarthrobacter sp. NamB4]